VKTGRGSWLYKQACLYLALSPDTLIYISVLKVFLCLRVFFVGRGMHKVRVKSSGTLCPVNWCIVTNVSKDRLTFPFRVKHSALHGFLTLKKRYEPSERWLPYQLTWPNIPEDSVPLCHNIKFFIGLYFLSLIACIILYTDCYWV
jgi:hypothetical protein